MGLNIKSPRVEANIRKLAERTGASLTEAVDKAVTEQLRRLDETSGKEESAPPLLERLQPLLDELAAKRIDHRGSHEIMEELYDEHGLPKCGDSHGIEH